jgi:hypothetical protein
VPKRLTRSEIGDERRQLVKLIAELKAGEPAVAEEAAATAPLRSDAPILRACEYEPSFHIWMR